MCQKALDMERSNGGERAESKCRKDKDHDLWVWVWISCRVQASSHVQSVTLEWFCKGCKHWVHKKCSGLKPLTEDPDYRCTRCQETARHLDGRTQREVQVGPDNLEVVASFCYLGNMLSAAVVVSFQPQHV